MFDHYEWFKKEVYRLTQINLNYYKEKRSGVLILL